MSIHLPAERLFVSSIQLLRHMLSLMVLLAVSTMAFAADPIKIEAEASEGVALNGVQIAQTPEGFSGSGFAWGFDAATDNIKFTFTAPAGEYNLSIGYYSPYGNKTTKLTVNGVDSDQVLTGTGTNFSAAAIGKFQLPEGQNTITMTNNWGYYGIDYILLTPVTANPPKITPLVNGRAEAEDGNLSGVNVSTANAGYSGTGYVTGFDNGTDQVSITFNATAGLYELAIGYASPFGDKSVSYQVNDDQGTNTFINTVSGYSTLAAGKYLLTEGLNTVVIRKGWGYFDIDYIQLTPTTVPLPVKPPKTLVDARATPSTMGLFSYMVDQYGSKLISGQQDDVEYVLEKTGKEPAIGAFDLMDYSPSRIENQASLTPVRTSEAMIDWAKKEEGRGIISLSWHWNAPTDLINEAPDKLWWSGFYTKATTFDLAAVLADKNGDRYQLLLRDIDAIAFQLKKLQAADVPVLWRPLHEASGKWFWWGAKGSGPFKELWQLVHNRLTNYHQLHNLIWVYTGTDIIDPDWYPGDAYVDIVGEDIYADAASNMSGNWENALSQFDGRKMVALSESGHLPNLTKVQAFATWWSWFSLWSGNNYIKNQPIDVLQSTFNSDLVITRDELPNWRPPVTLKVKHQDGDNGQLTNNSIKPNLTLVNEGSTAVPFSELTVRYWFTPENYAGINAWIDYAQMGNSRVKTRYVALENPRANAAGYLEYSFEASAGDLAANGNSGVINSRLANADWTNFNEANDYSYQAASQYGWNERITMYRTTPSGVPQLIWGIEPDVIPSTVKLKVYAQNKNHNTNGNSISTHLYIANEGNTPVAYGDLAIRYWFTSEGSQNLNHWVDYAKLGNGNIVGQFTRNEGRDRADTYLQLTVKPTAGVLSPGATTGNIQYRIAKSDWSAFNETNDYSFKAAAAFDTNSRITVYYRGQLISGIEPAAVASARLAAEEKTVSPLQVTLLGNPVLGEQAEITIQGAAESAVWLTLTDLKGTSLFQGKIEQTTETEHHMIPLGRNPGLFLLRVNTINESTVVKIIKP